MLYPIFDTREWSQRYGLTIEKSKCLCCGKEISIDVPVASKKFRGFKSREHGCPPQYCQYNLVPAKKIDQDEIEGTVESNEQEAFS